MAMSLGRILHVFLAKLSQNPPAGHVAYGICFEPDSLAEIAPLGMYYYSPKQKNKSPEGNGNPPGEMEIPKGNGKSPAAQFDHFCPSILDMVYTIGIRKIGSFQWWWFQPKQTSTGNLS